ncbi:MAG: DUF6048 family protein [Bacteroidaceae bacterium]|nr:DUF6048 family protein [Bacteroidaceae bacterium]
MHSTRIFSCIFTLLLSGLVAVGARGKDRLGSEDVLIADEAPFFGGIAVSADLVGFSMKAFSSKFANMEVAGRLNLMEKFFPIVELGVGDCHKSGSENDNKFEVTSPYFRVGMDYNFNKKLNGNRLFGGLRYGYSKYQYDFSAPDFADDVYGTSEPLSLTDLDGRNQWLELVVGVETKLWSVLRLGWNVRYKFRLKQRTSQYGEPWFVPGFGKNGGNTFGGTVNLTIDIGKTARKHIKKKTE